VVGSLCDWYNDTMNDEILVSVDGDQQAPVLEVQASINEKGILFLVMAVVLILDQVSKIIIENSISLNESWAPFPSISHIFRITHISNTGAAFGLFPSGSYIFMIVAVIVAIVIAIYNHQIPADNILFRIALGLQMGGALGNLFNRIRIGHVTDFLDFGPVPIFNVADSSIVIGVTLLILLMLQEYVQERKKVNKESVDIAEVTPETVESSEDHSVL